MMLRASVDAARRCFSSCCSSHGWRDDAGSVHATKGGEDQAAILRMPSACYKCLFGGEFPFLRPSLLAVASNSH